MQKTLAIPWDGQRFFKARVVAGFFTLKPVWK